MARKRVGITSTMESVRSVRHVTGNFGAVMAYSSIEWKI